MDEIVKKLTVDNWLVLTLARRSEGMEVWFRVDPRVEQFMASLAGGSAPINLDAYGAFWKSVGEPIKVYPVEKELVYDGYTLNMVGQGIVDARGNINLSFLQFVGSSKPEGIKFFLPGPFQGDFIKKTIKEKILDNSRKMFKQYVVPVMIVLKVTSDREKP